MVLEDAKPSPTRFRRLTKGWKLVSLVFPAVGMIVAIIYLFNLRPFGFVFMDINYRYILLAAFLPLVFLWIPGSRKASRSGVSWYDAILFLAGAAIPVYFASQTMRLLLGGWGTGAPLIPMVLGVVLWLAVIEAGRRAAGPVLAGVVAFFSFYPLFGSHVPGIMQSIPVSFNLLASYHALGGESIMGIPMSTFGDLLLGFMVFAVVVQMCGAGNMFNNLALAMVGRTRMGIAKVAVVGSGLFGTVSGASVANVFVTGTFTIPAMKKEGLPAAYAGAVEAVASTGGIIMPPVMGSTAFIMAEFMGVPYAEVALAAVIPALLYYVTLFCHIDSWAGLKGKKPSVLTVEVPPVWRTLANNFHIIVSFVVLIILIYFLRLTSQSPFIAAGIALVLGMFREDTRMTPRGFVNLIQEMGKVLGELVAALAPIGLIIGSFVLSGIAYSFPSALVSLAGGNIFLLLLFGAIAALILGMGVPIAAVYIFMAIVLAPALIAGGIGAMSAHMFVLYWAMMACITPPVAITAFAAGSIAEADPMKSGYYAMRLAGALYILPFIFAVHPELILGGTLLGGLRIIPATFIGFIIISGAIEGYLWRVGRLTIASRVLFSVAGLMLVWPGLTYQLYGAVALAVLFGLSYLLKQQRSPALRLMVRGTPSERYGK